MSNLGTAPPGAFVLGGGQEFDGDLNAQSINADWSAISATLEMGEAEVAANAIDAGWAVLAATLDLAAQDLDADVIDAGWAVLAATLEIPAAQDLEPGAIDAAWNTLAAALEMGEAEVAANAIDAGWAVLAATLDLAAQDLDADAIDAGWAVLAATLEIPAAQDLEPGAIDAAWNTLAAALEMGEAEVAANAIDAGWAVLAATLDLAAQDLDADVIDAGWAVLPASLIVESPPCDLTLAPITVGCVLEHIARRCGLPSKHYDFSDANEKIITGFVVAQRVSGAQAVADLLRAYDVYLYEADGKLKAGVYGGASQGAIDAGELGARLSGEDLGPPVILKRFDELELPQGGDITYFDPDNDYEQAQQASERYTKLHLQERVTFSPPLVLKADEARQIIERLVYRQWVEREQFTFRLGPKYLISVPGDVWEIPVLGTTARVRFISMDFALLGPIAVEAVLDDVDILVQTIGGATAPATQDVGLAETTILKAWSSPALRDQDAASNTVGFYVAAGPSGEGDWPGCQLYWSRDGGSTYEPLDTIEDASEFGVAASVLPAPSSSVGTAIWDTVNTVDVTMTHGVPVSATDLEVLNGANRAMLGRELIGFVNVTPLGDNKYRLSRLLRGGRGTDAYWATHSIGEQFVLLELGGAAIRVETGLELIGKTVKLKGVTFGSTLDSAAPVDLTITGDELRPYSGADGRGQRHVPDPNDWKIEWKRRTRIGGAWADLTDVPLGEATEEYAAEILDGLTVVRRFDGLTTSSFIYEAADQIADWGAVQSSVTVRVYQRGAIGDGFPYTFTVSDP